MKVVNSVVLIHPDDVRDDEEILGHATEGMDRFAWNDRHIRVSEVQYLGSRPVEFDKKIHQRTYQARTEPMSDYVKSQADLLDALKNRERKVREALK